MHVPTTASFRLSAASRTFRALACALAFLLGSDAACRGGVRINEFVADNSAGLTTHDGAAADWIELYNDAPQTVDLSGWFLTDSAALPTKWRIPDGTSIASNGYRVVFADSSAVSATNGELHANFSLSKDGEYLALVQPDGATVADAFAPAFPQQYEDVSYGRAALETECVGAGTRARYRVPNAAGTAPWLGGSGALGFASTNSAFTVSYCEMTGTVSTIAIAQLMATNSAYWKTDRTYPVVAQYATLNFRGNDASVGNFTNGVTAYPNHSSTSVDKNNFVLTATTALYVPQAGQWTFAVCSDDGFILTIGGHGVSFSTEYDTGRSFGATLATFTFPEAGVYSLKLVYFECTGGAALEFSAAQGYQSTLTTDAFRLVGDPSGGIQHAGLLSTFVETDTRAAMLNVSPRLDAEWAFTATNRPATNDAVTLYVRCADGFSASLNGTALASLNMPASLAWNSAATAARSIAGAQEWLAYAVPADAIVAGSNTLALTALNDAATNADFLIQPRLVWRATAGEPRYFKTPTPGAANGQAYTAPTPKVAASEPRGFKTAPFSVTLACEDNAPATIRYTLDGNTPGTNSAVYTGPLTITNTTVLRAAVVDPETLKQNVRTVTWLFLDDILKQGTNPPAGWPAGGAVNAQAIEYGLLPAVVTNDAARLRAGMTNSIPSISLVTDLTNLFSAASGIYVNPGNDGEAWERPASVELIDPVRGSNYEFRIDAGLRIRGAASRSTANPKHSFRLFFRSDYGEPTLKFKLFGDEGADEFEKVDLRTSQNYSWAWTKSSQDTFVRETFSRDTQRDMGQPYTRSRYYHLYLNGQYWGLYQTQERGGADFAATYIDGADDDWDCIKTSRDGSSGYENTATDGSFDAFYAFHNIAINEGFAGAYSNNYWRVRGLNPDGTANTNSPAYLDQDNLIDYMLVAYYTGDPDSPISIWGGFPNNMYALFNRANPGGFKWLRHDAEHSLGAYGAPYDVTCDTTYAGTNLTAQSLFNPGTLHQRLCQHPDYRMRFADLVRKNLYGDGALTPTNAQMRFRSRMAEIDTAIIGESARWGHGNTRDATWLPTCNAVLNTYLAQRRDIIVAHFRNHGWYPWLEVPAYSTNNAVLPYGQTLRVSATNDFYYTTDGSDPRLPGGGVSPAAVRVPRAAVTSAVSTARALISTNAVWSYYDAGNEPAVSNSLTWKDPGYPSASWPSGPAILGFAGSTPVSPVATVTRRYTNGVSGTQVTTTYFRRTFTLGASEKVVGIAASLLRDDGVVVYINGTEVLRDNMPSGAMSYTNFASGNAASAEQTNRLARTITAVGSLRAGENVVAAEVHQANASSTDLYFDLGLTAQLDVYPLLAGSADIAVTNALTVLARAHDGTDWSALAQASLSVSNAAVNYAPLRVSELMYAPTVPTGSAYGNDDFAWLELRNTGAVPLNLAGVHFAAGITHAFESGVLPADGRLVLAKNPAAFAERYATNGLRLVAWASGNLARKGETLSLVDPGGTNILTFTYSNTWYPSTYNTGLSLVAVDLAADEPLWSTAANWRPSHTTFGSPGHSDAPRFTAAALKSSRRLAFSTEGIDEADMALWFSEDLINWTRCDGAAWTNVDGEISVDLDSSALPASARGFFRLQIDD